MNRSVLIILLAFLVASCKDSTTTAPPLYLHGDLEGYVRLQWLTEPQQSFAGIEVSIEGTAYHATTDYRGHWRIPDLTTGTYTLRIARDSFGYVKVFNYPFVGGGIAFVPDELLFQSSNGKVRLLDLAIDSLEPYNAAVSGFAARTWPSYSLQDPIGIVIDTDSARIQHQPEYAPFFFPNVGGGLYANQDSMPLTITSLHSLEQVFGSRLYTSTLYARAAYLGNSNHLLLTKFSDPVVGRTIYSGTGEYSNVIRVRIK